MCHCSLIYKVFFVSSLSLTIGVMEGGEGELRVVEG
jgi:hypothetical protein